MMRIWLFGGTGGIGRHLETYLKGRGHETFVVSRSQGDHQWDPSADRFPEGFKDGDCIVNLCGAGIMDQRWTESRKRVLSDSRVQPLRAIGRWLDQMSAKPKVIITASGLNYYPESTNLSGRPYQEDGPLGNQWIAQLTQSWERAAKVLERHGNVCRLRMAMVLMKDAGAMTQFQKLAKWGMLSPVGSGRQPSPWVHVHDVCRLVEKVCEDPCSEAINVVANPTPDAQAFTKSLNDALGKKNWAPNVPAFAVKMKFGEASEILLTGIHADNGRMSQMTGGLEYTDLTTAVRSLLD